MWLLNYDDDDDDDSDIDDDDDDMCLCWISHIHRITQFFVVILILSLLNLQRTMLMLLQCSMYSDTA